MGELKEVLCVRTFRHTVTRTLGVRTQWLGAVGQVDVNASPQGATYKQFNVSLKLVSKVGGTAGSILGPRIQYGVLIVFFNIFKTTFIS